MLLSCRRSGSIANTISCRRRSRDRSQELSSRRHQPFPSDCFWNDVRRAIRATQHAVRFIVANHLLAGWVVVERPTEPVGNIGQMEEGTGDMCLLNRRMDVLCPAAANAIDKVGEVVAIALARGSRSGLIP